MLTQAQLATLKADIAADPVLSAYPMTPDGDFAIAEAYNLNATPNYFVWRRSVVINDLLLAPFDWTRVDNLTVGKARIWDWMSQIGVIDPSQANIRAGINACFAVAVGDAPCRQAMFNGSQRLATRVEKLYASGTGTSTTDTGTGPSVMAVEGPLPYQDVSAARALGTTR